MKKNIIIVLSVTCIFVLVGIGGYVYFAIIKDNSEQQMKKNLAYAKEIYNSIPVWHNAKKIKTREDLKIGFITDTHVHPKKFVRSDKSKDAERYLPQKDLTVIENFVADMKIFRPDFIVHLGDVIEGTDDADYIGIIGINFVKDELKKVGVPVYWAIGNHDLRSVTKEQFKQTVGINSLNQVFELGDYRFIILDGNFNPKGGEPSPNGNKYIPGYLPQESLQWLENQLKTDKVTFVFMHQGAYDKDLPGDAKEVITYREDGTAKTHKMKKSIANASQMRDILKEYNVRGFFNGHMEARYYEKKGNTNYYSLTGTKKSADFPKSYYELMIEDGVPNMTMYYLPTGEMQIKKVDFESGEK